MRTHMLCEMPPDRTGTMRELSLRALVTEFVTWRGRFPAPEPRAVHISQHLRDDPTRALYYDGLRAVIDELIAGKSLRPRLSKAVGHAYEMHVPATLQRRPPRRQHRDLLLSEWGIHHLHLSTEQEWKSEFLRRTRHVLLAAFRASNAYLIGIRAHESDGDNWAAREILEIAVRNWPEGSVVERVEFATGLSRDDWSDDDRRDLRQAGVNIGLEIDGKPYMPMGQTLDGAPMAAAHHAMHVQAVINSLRWSDEEPEAHLAARAAFYGVEPALWRAAVHRDEFGFFNDGVFIPYGRLVP